MSKEKYNDDANKIFRPIEIITPRDGVFAISDKVASSIKQARNWIAIAVPWLDMGFAELFREKEAKGLTVLLLTKKPETNNRIDERIVETAEALHQILIEKGGHFEWRHNPKLHDKFIVVDGVLGLKGSLNYTTSGRYHNFESLGVIKHDTALSELNEWFRFLWKHPKTKLGWNGSNFTCRKNFDLSEASRTILKHLREHKGKEEEVVLLQLVQRVFPNSTRLVVERLLERMKREGIIYICNEQPRVYSLTF